MAAKKWSEKGQATALTGNMELLLLDSAAQNASDKNVRGTLDQLVSFLAAGGKIAPAGVKWETPPAISVNNTTNVVTVSAGAANWNGAVINYAETTFTKSKPSSGVIRIDSVYAKEDGTYGYKDGTPSASGATPPIPANTLKVGDIVWTSDGVMVNSTTALLTDKDLFTLPDETRTYACYYLDTTGKNFPAELSSFSGILRVQARMENGGVLELLPFVGSTSYKCGYYYTGSQRVYEQWSVLGASTPQWEYFQGGASGIQTAYTITGTASTVVLVEVNGRIQQRTIDYTISGNTLTFTTPLSADSVCGVLYLEGVVSSAGGSSSWDTLTDKPTTVAGFGITDAYTKEEVNTMTQHAISGQNSPVTVANLWRGTQAQYDAIAAKDAATIYFIEA